MLLPKSRYKQNEKIRHRVKENKNDIDSNAVAKSGSQESKRDVKFNKGTPNYAEDNGLKQKTRYRNISSTDLPGLYKSINNNNGEYESSNHASYGPMTEDELDGLEPLDDTQQKPNHNADQHRFPFGSKASSFQNQHAIVCWFIVISSSIVVSM